MGPSYSQGSVLQCLPQQYLRIVKVSINLYAVTCYQKLEVALVLKRESWISVTLHFSIVTAFCHLKHFVEVMDIHDFDFWRGSVIGSILYTCVDLHDLTTYNNLILEYRIPRQFRPGLTNWNLCSNCAHAQRTINF